MVDVDSVLITVVGVVDFVSVVDFIVEGELVSFSVVGVVDIVVLSILVVVFTGGK